MKKYKMEVDISATQYLEIEAENEDDAREQALDEVKNTYVDDLHKIWELGTSVTSVEDEEEDWD